MTGTLTEFAQITDAEDYLNFFGLEFDPHVVNVNRLHILKQFANTMRVIDESMPMLSDEERLEKYKTALVQAYELFTVSNSVEQKLFKVFKDRPKNVVMLSEIGDE